MLTPSSSLASIVLPDMNMVDLFAVVFPLVQYDMISWKGDNVVVNLGELPKYVCTWTRPPCNCRGFYHVPVVVLGEKEVDMPYGLWEDMHRQFVCTQFLKINHPMFHVFYKSMEAQHCVVTKYHLGMHCKTLPFP